MEPENDKILGDVTGAMPDGADALQPVSAPVILPSVDPVEQAPEKRGRGRPRKDVAQKINTVTQATPRPDVVTPVPVAPLVIVDYASMGQQAANLWFNSGVLIFGQDWEPAPSDPPVIAGAFRDYFKSINATAIPPAWGLAMALIAYAGARLTKPTVKSRIIGAWLWIKEKTGR